MIRLRMVAITTFLLRPPDRKRAHGTAAVLPRCELPGYVDHVKVDKMSISFDPGLGDAVRAAAAKAGTPLSAWLADAAASKLRAEALAEFLAGWESQHGVLTAEEIARAGAELGLAGHDGAA